MAAKKGTKAVAKVAGNEALQEVLKKQYAKALKKTNKFNIYPRVSAQHGVKKPKFEIEGNDEIAELEVGILAYETIREFREDNDEAIPACSSVGGTYGTTFGKCSECEHGKWKEINGRNVKECKDSFKLLLKVRGLDGRFEIKIPGSSLKNFREYEKELTKDGEALGGVVTKLALTTMSVTGRKPWSVITFENVGGLDAFAEEDEEFVTEVAKGLLECEGMIQVTPPTENTAITKSDDDDAEDAEIVSAEGAVEVTDDQIPF